MRCPICDKDHEIEEIEPGLSLMVCEEYPSEEPPILISLKDLEELTTELDAEGETFH